MLPLALDILLAFVALLVFVVDLLMPAEEKRGLGILAAAGVALTLVASFFVDISGSAFGGAYVGDGVALYLKRIFLAAGTLGILLAVDHADKKFGRRQGEYYLLVLFSLLGMTLLASARDLVFLVVAFELMSLPLYLLSAIAKDKGTGSEAAMKMYLTGAASAAITLYGLSLVYGATGTTSLPAIAGKLAGGEVPSLMVAGMLVTLGGLGFKIGAVPFHMWVPDTYEGAPTPFVAYLSVAPKAAGFAVLIRLYLEGFLGAAGHWMPMLVLITTATMVLGNLLAIPQTNVKRLLAYSGIGQVGYMLLGLVVGNYEGVAMLLFFLVAYLFTNMGAFAVATWIGDVEGSDDIAAYRGLNRRSPGLAMAMLLFLLSLGGIPFVAGFWAKLHMFIAAFHGGLWLLVLVGALLSVLGLFYYLKIARSIYMEEPAPDARPLPAMGLPLKTGLVAACLGVVGVGVIPGPFIETALAAAKALLP
jgi:NADH-quinone oxidoreductase subunit N